MKNLKIKNLIMFLCCATTSECMLEDSNVMRNSIIGITSSACIIASIYAYKKYKKNKKPIIKHESVIHKVEEYKPSIKENYTKLIVTVSLFVIVIAAVVYANHAGMLEKFKENTVKAVESIKESATEFIFKENTVKAVESIKESATEFINDKGNQEPLTKWESIKQWYNDFSFNVEGIKQWCNACFPTFNWLSVFINVLVYTAVIIVLRGITNSLYYNYKQIFFNSSDEEGSKQQKHELLMGNFSYGISTVFKYVFCVLITIMLLYVISSIVTFYYKNIICDYINIAFNFLISYSFSPEQYFVKLESIMSIHPLIFVITITFMIVKYMMFSQFTLFKNFPIVQNVYVKPLIKVILGWGQLFLVFGLVTYLYNFELSLLFMLIRLLVEILIVNVIKNIQLKKMLVSEIE